MAPPKPKRPKVPKTVVTQAREVVSETKRPLPGVQRSKHEKLVKALKKLHPMD